MNFIENLLHKINELASKSLKNSLLVGVSVIFMAAFLYLYTNKMAQKNLCTKYSKIMADLVKAQNLINQKQLIDQEKTAIIENFTKQNSKGLLKIIESSAQELEIELENSYKSSLKTIAIDHEPDFNEQQATISGDKLSLKKIITLINSLRNENFVMFRELKIENNGKMPSYSILLSMRQKK